MLRIARKVKKNVEKKWKQNYVRVRKLLVETEQSIRNTEQSRRQIAEMIARAQVPEEEEVPLMNKRKIVTFFSFSLRFFTFL